MHGEVLKLAKHLSPPLHSLSVPDGHAVPHFPLAFPQSEPHRFVAALFCALDVVMRRDVVVGAEVVAQGLSLKLP